MILLVLVLVGLVAGSAAVLLAADIRSLLTTRARALLFLVLVLGVAARVPTGGHFYGLEYEDAFVFTAASRYMAENPARCCEGTRLRVCVVGSLSDCQWDGTSGGHLVGLPILGLAVHRLVGYSAATIPWINFSSSIAAVALLFMFCRRAFRSSGQAFAAAAAFAVAPAMAVFGSGGTSEPFSAALVLAYGYALGAALDDLDVDAKRRAWAWCLVGSSFALAIATRRENVLLVMAPLAAMLLARRRVPRALVVWTAIGVAVSVCGVLAGGFTDIEGGEGRDIGMNTFDLRHALVLVPTFAKALGSVRWFAGVPLLALLGVGIVLRRHRRFGPLLCCVFVLGFGVAYTLHYRSYYMVVGFGASPFEALRYTANFYPWVAALAGVAVEEIRHAARGRALGLVAWAAIGCGVGGALWEARWLRRDWVRDEFEVRVRPVLATLPQIAGDATLLLTDLAVVVHMYGSDQVRIIDSDIVEPGTNGLATEARHSERALWLKRTDDAVERARYPGLYSTVEATWRVGECSPVSADHSLCELIVR